MTIEADAKAVARRFFDELVNSKNLDLVESLISPDVVNHDPMPGEGPGTEGVKEVLRGFFAAVPDLFVKIDFMIADGEMVACRIQMRGTHHGVPSAEGKGVPFVMKG